MNPEIAEVLEGRKRWAVIHADNAEVLPGMPDKSVAHVITDPPYEAEAHTKGRRTITGPAGASAYGEGRLCREAPLDFDPITEDTRQAVSVEFGRIATRWVLAFCQAEALAAWRAAFEAGGLRWMRAAIWVKPNGQPQISGDRPGMGYESIACAHAKGKSAWNGGGKRGVFQHNIETVGGGATEERVHTTQKPVPLMLELVELFTDPDELVLDPFCGSGATLVAALRLGRRCIGIEKDARYAEIARERMKAEERGLNLRDARAGQISIFDEMRRDD